MKSIVLTGGGTAGHVTPNIALIPELKNLGYKISYIGSKNGIEKELVKDLGIDYYEISTGKLRRYLDIENIKDSFRVLKGVVEAKKIIDKLKPNIVFSKGGFVSVPVVVASYLKKTPVIIHESDITPGLANKICIPLSKKVCVTFPETLNYISKDKAVLTGSPIRSEIFKGSKEKGLDICGFTKDKPILLVMGGSSGSVKINDNIRSVVPELTKFYQIVHICGKNNLDKNMLNIKNYHQLEYAKDELKDILSASDLILSRSGSNAICEILSLKKPNLLIPLSKNASRGDQILNANSFKKQGFSKVLFEEDLTSESLIENIKNLEENKNKYIENMKKYNASNAVEKIIKEIKALS